MKGLLLFLLCASVIGIVIGYIGIELFFSHTSKKKAIKADSKNETEVEDLKSYKFRYKNVKDK